MNLIKKILGKFNGLHYHQEYLCLSLEAFNNPLFVYLVSPDNTIIKDVSTEHLFIGYKPVVIAMQNIPDCAYNCWLLFTNKDLNAGSRVMPGDIIASLALRYEGRFTETGSIAYFVAIKGRHFFLNTLNKWAMALSNRLYNDRPGNVFLPGNLYEQVHIAYAIPRKICLVTVAGKAGFNLFPTDLHGAIGDYYIISLRKEGKACAQVQAAGKVLLCDVQLDAHKQVYALGKNHMQECKDSVAFPFSSPISPLYNLPVPTFAIAVKELTLLEHCDIGIHRLLLFKIDSSRKLNEGNDTLSHIHNTYATWRYRQGIDTTYAMR